MTGSRRRRRTRYAGFAHDKAANDAGHYDGENIGAGEHRPPVRLDHLEPHVPAAVKVYVLDCAVTVSPNATLTLVAGTIVKTAGTASLTVQGTLRAEGHLGRAGDVDVGS